MKASFSTYHRIVFISAQLDELRKNLEAAPSWRTALEIQKLQKIRQKLQAEIKPTLIYGKTSE